MKTFRHDFISQQQQQKMKTVFFSSQFLHLQTEDLIFSILFFVVGFEFVVCALWDPHCLCTFCSVLHNPYAHLLAVQH